MLDPCSMFLPVGVGFTADVPKYAKGVTYSDAPAYLPGFGPGAGTEQQKTDWVPWAVGLGLIATGVWIAAGGVSLFANPTLAADWRAITWEKAYREALREGLKRGEAEEYAGEVLRAEEDDRINMLGGALDPPEEGGWGKDYAANPHCVRARHRHNPGRAQELGFTEADADPHELALGIKHELEHTKSRAVAKRIALDHLAEDGRYYTHLTAMEKRVKGR